MVHVSTVDCIDREGQSLTLDPQFLKQLSCTECHVATLIKYSKRSNFSVCRFDCHGYNRKGDQLLVVCTEGVGSSRFIDVLSRLGVSRLIASMAVNQGVMTSRALTTASPAPTVPAAVSTVQAVEAQSLLLGKFKALLYV